MRISWILERRGLQIFGGTSVGVPGGAELDISASTEKHGLLHLLDLNECTSVARLVISAATAIEMVRGSILEGKMKRTELEKGSAPREARFSSDFPAPPQ
jgi:hypothetical protein